MNGMISTRDVVLLSPLDQAFVSHVRRSWEKSAREYTNPGYAAHFERHVALAIKNDLLTDPALDALDANAPVDQRGEVTEVAKVRAVPLGRTQSGKYAALVIQAAGENGLVEGGGHKHPLGTLQVIVEGTGVSALVDENVGDEALALVPIPYKEGSVISNESNVAHAFKPDRNTRGERIVAFLALTNDLLSLPGNVAQPSPAAQALFSRWASEKPAPRA
jgi:hypothetical protein